MLDDTDSSGNDLAGVNISKLKHELLQKPQTAILHLNGSSANILFGDTWRRDSGNENGSRPISTMRQMRAVLKGLDREPGHSLRVAFLYLGLDRGTTEAKTFFHMHNEFGRKNTLSLTVIGDEKIEASSVGRIFTRRGGLVWLHLSVKVLALLLAKRLLARDGHTPPTTMSDLRLQSIEDQTEIHGLFLDAIMISNNHKLDHHGKWTNVAGQGTTSSHLDYAHLSRNILNILHISNSRRCEFTGCTATPRVWKRGTSNLASLTCDHHGRVEDDHIPTLDRLLEQVDLSFIPRQTIFPDPKTGRWKVQTSDRQYTYTSIGAHCYRLPTDAETHDIPTCVRTS